MVFRFLRGSPFDIADIDDLYSYLDSPPDSSSGTHDFVELIDAGNYIDLVVASDDPVKAFELCCPWLQRQRLLTSMIVAYCHNTDDDYRVLHPEDFAEQFAR